jgi:AcrR family transcriptional regulator
MSTDVKRGATVPETVPLSGRERRAAQGAATRAALLEAARELFGSLGFADTSLDDVVARAGVTKGALYHHFGGKEVLFEAVYEQVQREVSDRVVEQFLLPDPWEALLVGCDLWIDAHVEPSVQRIVLRDARAVLGWQVVRDVENRFGVVPLRGVLRRAVRVGLIEGGSLRPLALMVMGALTEACFYVADADDATAAREEVRTLMQKLLRGLSRTPPEGWQRPLPEPG